MEPEQLNLRWLLSPYSDAAFLELIWQKRPLHVLRNSANYYAKLTDSGEINFIISSACKLDCQAVELISDDTPKQACPSFAEACTAFAQGKTVRITRANRFSRRLTELCNSVEEEVGCLVNLNLYCSPAQSRALPLHYDRHDVFALQLGGRKKWCIYDVPIAFPIEYVPPLRGESIDDAKRFRLQPKDETRKETACKLLEEFTLQPGDMCYVPRGYWHEAHAESVSYHLTVGLQMFTYLDLLTAALTTFANKNMLARQSLPRGFAQNRDYGGEVEHTLRSLLAEFAHSAELNGAAEDLAAVFWRRRHSIADRRAQGASSVPPLAAKEP